MSQKPIEMSQLNQIRQLLKDHVGIKEIARRTGVSKNTVKKYVRRMEAHPSILEPKEGGKTSDKALAEAAYNDDTAPVSDKRAEALLKHFDDIKESKELTKTGVTRQQLWKEYIEQHPEGYQYSQYCNLLGKYHKQHEAVYHWDHKPGEFIQADFAGDTFPYFNKQLGKLVACQIFVAVLPFCGLIFCYAVHSQRIADFAICIVEMIKYFGGITLTVLVDNFRTAVKRSDIYEPIFTDLCHRLSDHYNTTFSATRPAKPRDKAAVERAVNIVYQHIYAPLRKETLTSLEGVNSAFRKQLDILNNRPYKGAKESRMEIFIRAEKPLLKLLPETHFQLMKSKPVTVQNNYYFQLPDNKHYYSVPFKFVGKQLIAYFNSSIVEVYYNHERVSVHVRRSTEPHYNMIEEHMKENHKAMEEQRKMTSEKLLKSASYIGEYTTMIANRIIHSSIYPQQNFKACRAMIALDKKYSKERLEAACKHAVVVKRPTLKLIKEILATGQDKAPLLFEEEDDDNEGKKLPSHENIRGKDYYK
jgi:transposase